MGAWIEIGICVPPSADSLVAPLVGAWIEILQYIKPAQQNAVAPLVGAWIEIPSWPFQCPAEVVAPLVGAWIEIRPFLLMLSLHRTSLPLWERGLKSLSLRRKICAFGSLPLWERGLKSCPRTCPRQNAPVAPLVGAWIEISWALRRISGLESLPLRERGLKYEGQPGSYRGRGSLPLRERGLKYIPKNVTGYVT